MRMWYNRVHSRANLRFYWDRRICQVWAPRSAGVTFLLACLVLFGCSSGENSSGQNTGGEQTTGARDTARYKAEVDEGLGASIAILLDQSGSMDEKAEGDRRPKYVVAREALETLLAAT